MQPEKIGDSDEEVFATIGATLLVIQQFELLVERSLKLIYSDRADQTFEKIFAEDKRSLGILISDVRKKTNMAEDADNLLKGLLEDRNLFVHRLCHQDWFDAYTEEGRDAFWSFMGTFTPKLHLGNMLFSAILFRHAEQSGVDPAFFDQLRNHEFYLEVRRYYPDVNKIKKKA